jgi:hypothetical protein
MRSWSARETVAVVAPVAYVSVPGQEFTVVTVMLAKTYAAFKAAGVPDEQAQSAAEELGDAQVQYGELRSGMGLIHADIAYLRGRFDVLIWAVGINAAATIAILGVLLRR